MIQEHIEQIQAKVQQADSLPLQTKSDLLDLLAALKSEVGALSETRKVEAQSVANFVDASAQEALRIDKQPELLDASLEDLTGSVDGLEATHPKLVELVNRIALTLSNMGI